MEGGSIWKGMLCIYLAKVPGNTTGLPVTPPSFLLLLFQTLLKVGTIPLFFFFKSSPELRGISILYVLHINRAAGNWDLPSTPILFNSSWESSCSQGSHTHLRIAIGISSANFPCLFPLRLPFGKAGAGVPHKQCPVGAPQHCQLGEPATHRLKILCSYIFQLCFSLTPPVFNSR